VPPAKGPRTGPAGCSRERERRGEAGMRRQRDAAADPHRVSESLSSSCEARPSPTRRNYSSAVEPASGRRARKAGDGDSVGCDLPEFPGTQLDSVLTGLDIDRRRIREQFRARCVRHALPTASAGTEADMSQSTGPVDLVGALLVAIVAGTGPPGDPPRARGDSLCRRRCSPDRTFPQTETSCSTCIPASCCAVSQLWLAFGKRDGHDWLTFLTSWRRTGISR